MGKLALSTAQKIISSAFEKAAELNLKPLTVAVLDDGGHVIALSRQDGSSIMRPQIATGKAFGALAVGTGTRWLNANAESPFPAVFSSKMRTAKPWALSG